MKSKTSPVARASASIVVRSCAEVFGTESADTDDRKMCDVLHHHLAKVGVPPPCWIPPAAGAVSASSLARQSGSLRAPRGYRLPHDQPSRRVGCAANLIAVGWRPGGFRADPGPHDQGHFMAPGPSTNRPPVGCRQRFAVGSRG
jgi:hypothetical protein